MLEREEEILDRIPLGDQTEGFGIVESPPPRCGFQASLSYGSLSLSTRFLLSPLAGYTNLPFRRVIHEIGGVGLCTTDLVNARGILNGSRKSLELIETHPEDRPFAVQIFGHEPPILAECARLLEQRGVDSIDINMGCPVDHVTKIGAGARMMCSPRETIALVRTVVDAVKLPVTVKMRLGWDSEQITAPLFAREFEQVGVAAVAIHGRTRAQGFSGQVDRGGIRRVVEAVQKIPVIGNGDIRTIEDARRMLEETGCQGVSIGRGALANPWIFQQLSDWEQAGKYSLKGTFRDRMELLLRQYRYLREQVGEERSVSAFRKMAHWYLRGMRVSSFLRNQFQLAQNDRELWKCLEAIAETGPNRNIPADWQIQVPGGPNEHW